MRIVILGPPGSGKRTQTGFLAKKYALTPIMTGDLLKRAMHKQTALGIEIKGLQDQGEIVTEDILLALLREHLLEPALQNGFVLDGFPRNLLQALTLDELLVEIDQPLDMILLVDIGTDTLMERLVGRRTCRSCGLLYNIFSNPTIVEGVCDACGGRLHQRSDDNEETVSSRIHVFDHLISPLITHYEKQGKLVKIDGNGEKDQVFLHICRAIQQGLLTAREMPEKPRSVARAVEEEEAGAVELPSEKKSSLPGKRTAPEEHSKVQKTATISRIKKKTTSKKATKKKIVVKTSKKRVVAQPAKKKAKTTAKKKAPVKKAAQVKNQKAKSKQVAQRKRK